MSPLPAARLDHLRRLTDSRGLMHAAIGDCPDRSRGYDAIDNADALRLCAVASDTVFGETVDPLAMLYFAFLNRARLKTSGVHHGCDAAGKWVDDKDDALVQSRLARALAAVVVSELPIKLRLAAAEWWSHLLPLCDGRLTPVAAGHWLIALGTLKAADPGRDLQRVAYLALWLADECYASARTQNWEWFEPQWSPESACIPAGLWHASAMLEDPRLANIARTTTEFVIRNSFAVERLMPVGTRGGWPCGSAKAIFDQTPSEVTSIIDLCQTAHALSREPAYHDKALRAASWYRGENINGSSLIDPKTGACYRALRADGPDRNQNAPATLAYLLAQASLSEPSVTEVGSASHIVIG